MHVALVPVSVGDNSTKVLALFLDRNATFPSVDPDSAMQLPSLHEGMFTPVLTGSFADEPEKNGGLAVIDSHV